MKSLKTRNAVYYSYAIINFLWYALCGGAVATVFEKGLEMYEELKLTV